MISVITVVYNAEKCIEKTIQSVINQKNVEIEYLIIDGQSSDNTLKIINQYKDSIDILISEKDNGIYDAMNKGILNSHGEWLFFLNAGDIFYTDTVLSDLISKNLEKKDIIYGNVCGFDSIIRKSPTYFNKKSVLLGSMICHQAILANRNTFTNNLFSLDYKIISDRIWLHKALNHSASLKYVDIPISYYDMTGVSMNVTKMDTELIRYIKSNGFIWIFIFLIRKTIFRNVKKYLLRLKNGK